MSEEITPGVRLALDEIELPATPGSRVKFRILEGREPFFGPRGVRLGEGFTLNVSGDLWSSVLTAVRSYQTTGELEVEVTVVGRYGQS